MFLTRFIRFNLLLFSVAGADTNVGEVTAPAIVSQAPPLNVSMLDRGRRNQKSVWNATFKDVPSYSFKCPSLSRRSTPPAHVHDVRPDDIQIVMAIGDSVLTGMNSRYPHGISKEYKSPSTVEHRGINFATGDDADAISLGKLVKQYSPSIVGLSQGTARFEFCYGPLCVSGSKLAPFQPNVSGLNAAQAGAWATIGNAKHQFLYLDRYYDSFVKNLKPLHDGQEPWKLAIVQIGANNLCLGGCHTWTSNRLFSARKYKDNARFILQQLRNRYKNMIVLLMGPLHLSTIEDVIRNDDYCQAYRRKNAYGCTCLDLSWFRPDYLTKSDALADQYNYALREVADEFNQANMGDFGIVYDDSLTHLDVTGQGVNSLSGLDCLHPSTDAHTRVAMGAWYNLFHSKKSLYNFSSDPEIYCPTESDRIVIG